MPNTARSGTKAGFQWGKQRKAPPKRSGKPARPDPSGHPATGRISKIARGQGHGYIRLRDDREVYFHRGDVQRGAAFNDLAVGDRVTFEAL